MKTEINAFSVHIHKEKGNLETGGIWEDAGFKPPQFYIQLIEFLHITFLNEGFIPEFYLKEIIKNIESPAGDGLFLISDRKRMYSFAESLGIDVLTGDEERIASGITERIISDYLLPDLISPVNERMIFPGKNGLARKYSTLKV